MSVATGGSVSRIPFTASVRGKGDAKVSILRHLSPLTVNAVVRASPIESRVNIGPGTVCMFTNIRVGVEKGRTSFERGDVAFLASGALLCFFLKSAKSERPLNPVGKIDSGTEILDGLRLGDVIVLKPDVEVSASETE